MRSTFLLAAVAALALTSALRAAEPTGDAGTIKFTAPNGWAVTPDLTTLIVSVRGDAKLAYFDTVTNALTREVEIDFKPAALALQGDTLFAATDGAAVVYALDAKTGKVLKEFAVPDAAVAQLACHPKTGLVYASSGNMKVYAIDPKSGEVAKTSATGTFLAVDPVKGDALFTGVQPPINDATFLIKEGPDGSIKIIEDRWGARAVMLKYDITPKGLKYAAAQRNASVNGGLMRLTPDGQRVTILGGGGWRPPAEGGTGGGYVAAVYAARDLQTMMGQAPHGRDLAFHPALPIGVVNHDGRDLTVFNARSYVVKGKVKAPVGAGFGGELLTFGGKGTKVVFWNGEGLQLAPLTLTADDRATLTKAYGKLPPPPEALEFKAAATPGAASPAALPKGVLAEAGFNDAKGIHADKAADSPYPLGQSGRDGGRGEPGWEGPWPANGHAEYQTAVVAEGDGAVKLRGTTHFIRKLKDPVTKPLRVEQKVRIPANGGFKCYVQGPDGSAEGSGPLWSAGDGGFHVHDGNEGGSGNWIDTKIPYKVDTWHDVTVVVDFPKKRWELWVDGKKFDHPGLRYRGRPPSIQIVNYLVETPGGVYIDLLRVLDGAGEPTANPPKK